MSRRNSRKSMSVVPPAPAIEEFVSSTDFDFGAAFKSPKGVVTRARRSSIGGNAPVTKAKGRRQTIMPTLEEVPAEKPANKRRSVLPPPPKTKIPVKKAPVTAKPAPAAAKKPATKEKNELVLILEDDSPPVSPIKADRGILSSSFYGTPKKAILKEPTKEEKKASAKVEKKAPAKVEKKAPLKVEKKVAAKVVKKSPAKVEKKVPAKVEKKAPTKVEKKAPTKVEKKAPAKVEKKAPAKVEKKEPIAPTEEKEKPLVASPIKAAQGIMTTSFYSSPKKQTDKPLVASPIKAAQGIMATSFYNSPKKIAKPEKSTNDDSLIEDLDDMFVITPKDGVKPTKTFETEAPEKTKRRRTMIEIKSPIVKVKENEKTVLKSKTPKPSVKKMEMETSTPKKTPKTTSKKVEPIATKTPTASPTKTTKLVSKTPKKTPKITKSLQVNIRKMTPRMAVKTPATSKKTKTTVVSTKKQKAKTPKISPKPKRSTPQIEKSTPVVSTKVIEAKTPKATPLVKKQNEEKSTPQIEKSTPVVSTKVTKAKTPKATPLTKKLSKENTPKPTPKTEKPTPTTKTAKTPKLKTKTPNSTTVAVKAKTPKSTPKLPTTGNKRKLTLQITPTAKRLKTNQAMKTPAAINPGNLLKRKLKQTVETAIDEKIAKKPNTTPHIIMEGVSESGSPRKILAPLQTSTIETNEVVKQHITGTPALKRVRKMGTALRPNPIFMASSSTLRTPQKKETTNSTPMKENRFAGAPHPLDDVEATPILGPGKIEPISPEPQMVTGKLGSMCSIM